MANKGQDALHSQERQGATMWSHIIPPPSPMEKSQAPGCVICMELPIVLGVSQCEDAVSSFGPIWGEFLACSEDSARSNRWAVSQMARQRSAVPLTESRRRNKTQRCPRRVLQKFDHRSGDAVFGNKQATWEELEDSWLFQYKLWKLQAGYQQFFIGSYTHFLKSLQASLFCTDKPSRHKTTQYPQSKSDKMYLFLLKVTLPWKVFSSSAPPKLRSDSLLVAQEAQA